MDRGALLQRTGIRSDDTPYWCPYGKIWVEPQASRNPALSPSGVPLATASPYVTIHFVQGQSPARIAGEVAQGDVFSLDKSNIFITGDTMTSQETWDVEQPWLEIRCLLGEAPFYERDTGKLRFVDIKQNRLHTVSLKDGPSSLETIQLDTRVSVTANIDGVDPRERIIVGSKYGPAVLDRTTNCLQLIARFNKPHNERIRSNDGACDPHGRFWIGTMTDFGLGDFKPEGMWSISNAAFPCCWADVIP